MTDNNQLTPVSALLKMTNFHTGLPSSHSKPDRLLNLCPDSAFYKPNGPSSSQQKVKDIHQHKAEKPPMMAQNPRNLTEIYLSNDGLKLMEMRK